MSGYVRRLWACVMAVALVTAAAIALASRHAVIRLSPPGTGDALALRLYQRAAAAEKRGGVDDLRAAIEQFDQATARDPSFAAAWANSAIARTRLCLLHALPPELCMPQAKAAALRALEIDGSLPEAHVALAGVKMWNEWEWERAEGELQQAIDLSPSLARAYLWYGALMTAQKRYEEAVFRGGRALDLDPLSPEAKAGLGWTALCSGRVEDALAIAESFPAQPPGGPEASLLMWAAAESSGAEGDAAELARRAAEMSPDCIGAQVALARSFARTGRRQEAAAMIEKIASRSPYGAASVQAALGGDFLSYLDRALAAHDPSVIWLDVDPAFDGLRGSERLQLLVEKLGLGSRARNPKQFAVQSADKP